jgi:hypothetical protein
VRNGPRDRAGGAVCGVLFRWARGRAAGARHRRPGRSADFRHHAAARSLIDHYELRRDPVLATVLGRPDAQR